MRYLLLFLILTSCSAEWHLKQAVKKNPKYGEKQQVFIPYQKDTIIYRTIYLKGDSSMQESKLIIDSLNKVYNDSFTTVYQLIDSLGKIKTSVVRKPKTIYDTIPITIYDTIPYQIAKPITVKNQVSNLNWTLLLIFLILFLLLIHNLKK